MTEVKLPEGTFITDRFGNPLDSIGSPLLKVKAGDYISVTYPNTVTEIYTIKIGGVSGITVCIITVIYTTETKDILSSISSQIS